MGGEGEEIGRKGEKEETVREGFTLAPELTEMTPVINLTIAGE